MNRTNILAAVFSLMVVGPVVWMSFDRELPYAINSGVTVPKEIIRGKPYRIEWKLTNGVKDCPGAAYRFAKDSSGKIWTLRPVETGFSYIPLSNGVKEDVIVEGYPRSLDPDTALGPIEFFGTNVFHCNILQLVWPIQQVYPIVRSTVIE